MCIGIPMRVLEGDEMGAWCEGRGERRRLGMMLVGAQPAGTWVLAFLDEARSVLAPEAVGPINEALDALEAILRGDADVAQRVARLQAPARDAAPQAVQGQHPGRMA